MKISLVVKKEDRSGTRVPVKSTPFVIGRHEECQLRIKSKTVSRKHCVITEEDDGRKVIIKDLGSRNGTVVNDMSLRKGESSRLFHGDRLKIGKAIFVLSIHDELTDLPEFPTVAFMDDPSGDEVTATTDTTLFSGETTAKEPVATEEPTTNSEPTQVEPSKESQDPLGKVNGSKEEDADAEEEADDNDKAKSDPKPLPKHLRPQGPVDSQQAANDALRRLFSQGQ